MLDKCLFLFLVFWSSSVFSKCSYFASLEDSYFKSKKKVKLANGKKESRKFVVLKAKIIGETTFNFKEPRLKVAGIYRPKDRVITKIEATEVLLGEGSGIKYFDGKFGKELLNKEVILYGGKKIHENKVYLDRFTPCGLSTLNYEKGIVRGLIKKRVPDRPNLSKELWDQMTFKEFKNFLNSLK